MGNSISNTAENFKTTSKPSVVKEKEITSIYFEGRDYSQLFEEPVGSGTDKQPDEISNRLSLEDIRKINRGICSQKSDIEYQKYLEERSILAQKEAKNDLNQAEKVRLNVLRWQIECIEDAKLGPYLDKLEQIATFQNQMAERVASFVSEAKQIANIRKNRKKR